jgi:DNA-binding transcriptional LysR family regulator
MGWAGGHAVERDIADHRLVALSFDDVSPTGIVVPMRAIYPTSAPPGPAGRWLIERLKQCRGMAGEAI